MYHSHHIVLHQQLQENDFRNKILFYNENLRQMAADENCLGKILFSDEATFKSNGIVNRHNMHYYAVENTKWMRQVNFLNKWSLNVWCGIINDKIIGPYFFDQQHVLREYLPQLLENVDLQTRHTMWFQHDDAPAHYHHDVREILNGTYTNK